MKLFRSISSIALALLVLLSSTSFMVGMHFCGGHVQDVALFTKAKPCMMEMKTPPCHKQAEPCCADETIVHKGQEFKASAAQPHLLTPTPIDIEQPSVLISVIIPSITISQTEYFNYDPPLRTQDLTVEHHVFLI
jgi:hypothetical protein